MADVTDGGWLNSFKDVGGLGSYGLGGALAGIGSAVGGFGSLYGAYNANKLGNAQIDLTKQQNQLLMDKYNQDKKDKEDLNSSFGSIWGGTK